MTMRKMAWRASTVCVAATMFALAGCAAVGHPDLATTAPSNPYADVGYAGPAYADGCPAILGYGYVDGCNPYYYDVPYPSRSGHGRG
jgi:hypothetical protein